MAAIVSKITDIRKHTNADSLDVCQVMGWQLVVKSEQFQENEKVVYFEPATVMPEYLADQLGVKKFLSTKVDINGNKVLVVNKIKLRGEPSFGLCIPYDGNAPLNLDVSSLYSVTKFDPPIKFYMGQTVSDIPEFEKYSGPNNLRSAPHVFSDGELVYVTEKIHGTNSRVGFIRENGEVKYLAGSKNYLREQSDNVKYWHPLSLQSVQDLLTYYVSQQKCKTCILYGELFGPGIQKYTYGATQLSYVAFDLMINGAYLDYSQFYDLCDLFAVPKVPLIAVMDYSLKFVKDLSSGPSLLGGAHNREGVVVRPQKERVHPKYGRFIMKYVSDEFLFGEGDKNDFTDI